MGTPLSVPRIARVALFWRQNSLSADILSILFISNLNLWISSKNICSFLLKMATNNPEAEEVSRVNKLLQIEDLAWSKQLEKAVSGFLYLNSLYPFPILSTSLSLNWCPLFLVRVLEIPLSLCGMQAAS